MSGSWSSRTATSATASASSPTAFGIQCDLLRAEWGHAVSPAEVKQRLDAGSYAAVTITHVDTSTGTAAPVEAYCDLLRGRKELVILDGVCATAGMDERFDEWGVDVLLTGPQKAIGAPPGVALCIFSERALERRRARSTVPAYYADVLRWLPVMQDPGRYYSTPCVNEIVALAEPHCGWCTKKDCRRVLHGTPGSRALSAPGSKRPASSCSPHPTAAPTRSPS